MPKYIYPIEFDRNRAQELCNLVDAAYSQFNQGEQWVSPQGYHIVAGLAAPEFSKGKGFIASLKALVPEALDHFLPKVPFGFVATKDNDVYVVIRGTITLEEWLDDASTHPEPFTPSGVAWGNSTHGFMRLYNYLEPEISNAIQQIKDGGNNLNSVFITGHSLGGALSHLAAAGINSKFNIKPISYTFSGPRAGDPGFAEMFVHQKLQTWRIFNTEDIIPTLPPAAVVATEPSQQPTASDVIKKLLGDFSMLSINGYQHIGYPIAATFHSTSIAGNHSLDSLCQEILL